MTEATKRCKNCSEEILKTAKICKHCQKRTGGGMPVWLSVVIGLCVFSFLCLAGCVTMLGVGMSGAHKEMQKEIAQESGVEPGQLVDISIEQFNKLREGMNYKQVRKILGRDGVEISSNSLAGYKTVMYEWKNADFGNMNAMFQNGRLNTKAQFNLK